MRIYTTAKIIDNFVPMLLVSFLSLSMALTTQSFLVMGDMPYSPIDEIKLRQPHGILSKAVAATEHGFLLHLGDMKAGAQPCTNQLLNTNKALLTALTTQPFIYTLGDNEWTDCDREGLTPRFDELERLDYVKDLMFDENYYQQAKRLQGFTTQPGMPENARWQFANIGFMTLHVVGTENGRQQILRSDPQLALGLADKRDEKNLAWLTEGLENTRVRGYVIGFQADIYNVSHKPACTKIRRSDCDAFKLYRDAVIQFANNTDKPVLVMHGDTGPYCHQRLSQNLTRLNVAGDYVVSDITKVSLLDSVDGGWVFKRLTTDLPLLEQCQ
ncbi:hypothetical protein [Pseudoalteromonas mariniglutinosa]|uniref:hypothetical protein n=1 Tax=Pseudoalteromonas mariniglutinosa TaxID=206042 RepID=UPI0038514414